MSYAIILEAQVPTSQLTVAWHRRGQALRRERRGGGACAWAQCNPHPCIMVPHQP